MTIFDDQPIETLDDMAGIDDLKSKINKYIDVNIKNREKFKNLGFERSRNHVLIKGPEGCGKSTLALALVKIIGYPHVWINLFD